MIMKKAVMKAKRNDEEKVGLNIKIPISMKNEFEQLCKENGVSMTAMMLSLIEVAIEEFKGAHNIHDIEIDRLVNLRISDLKRSKEELEKTGGGVISDTNGHPLDVDMAIQDIEKEIQKITDLFLGERK
jgi:hypothetical protein